MRFTVILITLLLNAIYCKGQIVTGQLIDSESKEALPYVNIGIVGRNVGTVSDDNGHFTIELNSQYDADTFKISMIGYTSLQYQVSKFKQHYSGNNTIILELSKNTTLLKEIVVRPVTYVTKIAGNTAHSASMIAGFASNNLGYELGTVMKVKKFPAYIENLNFNIARNQYDSVTFRVNIYKMKNGMPSESILTEPIFITTSMKIGTLTIDMKKYNLEVDGDFLVSLEWIKNLEGNGLYFCCGLFNADSFKRSTSQGKWEPVEKIGMSFYSTIIYAK